MTTLVTIGLSRYDHKALAGLGGEDHKELEARDAKQR